MAKEILRDLDADITRLLVAGAALAAADEGLSARRSLVGELAAKAPALAKVSAQIDATRATSGRKSASELLNLAAMSAQIRGAQAKPAEAPGSIEPLAPRAPMDTPLASAEADKLYRVLIGKSDEPEHVLETALEANAVVDLRFARLVTALVGGGIDEEIVVKVVRAYGEEAVGAIEASFDPRGSGTDATRLQIIALVRGADALALVERAFAEGSAAVRAQALSSWVELDPEAAIRVAIERAMHDKASDVRESAIDVLGMSKNNDAALDALFEALVDEDYGWRAEAALRAIEHPARTARALALLTPELRRATEHRPKAKKKGAKASTGAAAKAAKTEEERLIREASARVALATHLINLMPDALTDEVEHALFDTWTVAKDENIKEAAGRKLARTQREDIYRSLVAGVTAKGYAERMVAIDALTGVRDKTYERVAPYLTEKNSKDKKLQWLIDAILTALQDALDGVDDEGDPSSVIDPRVGALVLAVRHGSVMYRWTANDLLRRLRPAGFYEVLEREARDPKQRAEALEALAELGDRRALALALEIMADKKVLASLDAIRAVSGGVAGILAAFDDPETIAPARAFYAHWSGKRKGKSSDEWSFNQFNNTLLNLERAR